MMRITLILLSAVAAIQVAGCATPPRVADDVAKRQVLALVMPSRIEIVEPFTRVASFDGDPVPDGIELIVRAVNVLDDDGLMLAGRIRVELFEHVAASGIHRGKRLDSWEVELSTTDQQKSYWNRMTQMYEFRLGVNPSHLTVANTYVLAVTYLSPLGERLGDEFVISDEFLAEPLGSR